MSKPRNTTGKGYFAVKGSEPLAKRMIGCRLPESLDAELRAEIGEDLTNWVRQTLIEKWEDRSK